MKIVVISDSGLIEKKLVHKLTKTGHQVVVASSGTGVNATIGEGLAKVLVGAQVITDIHALYFGTDRKVGDLGRL